ncbi:hypothetical protein M422DRAFT_781874 [Sphaerobolus stellatus SS14]|uniref:Uncharacterized protein n=1 Tax=Sphaerobolus stellatus (strain SS14) TaxID=990650 RepID=A0A0C9UQY4_SPHS4|nr:hypothetical protein M422DRAFT_781874 [Sphaerobolus stellatus SS14]
MLIFPVLSLGRILRSAPLLHTRQLTHTASLKSTLTPLKYFPPISTSSKGFTKLDLKVLSRLKGPLWCRTPLQVIKQCLIAGQITEARSAFRIGLRISPLRQSEKTHAEVITYYRLAIWLFAHAWDFDSAIMLVNQMIEQEMEVPVNVWMTLLYGTKHHHPEHVRQVCEVLAAAGRVGRMNDSAFTSLLHCFVRAGYPLERIKAITKKYVGRQPKGWVPGPGFFTPLIQSYTAHGDVIEAQAALQKYRDVLGKAKVMYRYRTLRKSYARLHRDFFRGWLAKSQLNVPKPNIEKPRRPVRHATPLSAPYTAYLELFQKRGVPVERLESTLSLLEGLMLQMKTDGIEPDIHFYNSLIRTLTAWVFGRVQRGKKDKIIDMIIDIYRQLITSPMYPFPNSSTFTHILRRFPLSKEPHIQRYTDKFSRRLVFRDLLIYASQEQSLEGPVKEQILTIDVCNAALSVFLKLQDYPAAIVVIRSIEDYSLNPNDETREHVREYIWEHAQRGSDPQWSARFLGDQPKEYEDCEAVISALSIHRAIYPRLSAQTWVLQEWVKRALKVKLGYQVSWGTASEEGDGDAEGSIRRALREMIPSEEASMEILKTKGEDGTAMIWDWKREQRKTKILQAIHDAPWIPKVVKEVTTQPVEEKTPDKGMQRLPTEAEVIREWNKTYRKNTLQALEDAPWKNVPKRGERNTSKKLAVEEPNLPDEGLQPMRTEAHGRVTIIKGRRESRRAVKASKILPDEGMQPLRTWIKRKREVRRTVAVEEPTLLSNEGLKPLIRRQTRLASATENPLPDEAEGLQHPKTRHTIGRQRLQQRRVFRLPTPVAEEGLRPLPTKALDILLHGPPEESETGEKTPEEESSREVSDSNVSTS